jgi:glucosamine kinase
MILIADSGSTKTHWALVAGSRVSKVVKTSGINPFFRDSGSILEELAKELMPQIGGKISELFFYGAGIVNEEKGAVVKNLLKEMFPGARVETQSDLLAAARATCGTHPGIACILGTGSNSCIYDGTNITEQVSPLGFILGDEGSGAVMGRKLLGDYFKMAMPAELRDKFNSDYRPTKEDVLEKVYRKERPNLFLARFTEFLYKNIGTEYCNSFVRKEFEAFAERNILKYPECRKYEVSSVGSVGYYFHNILRAVLESYSLKCGVIIEDPLEALVNYHLKKK